MQLAPKIMPWTGATVSSRNALHNAAGLGSMCGHLLQANDLTVSTSSTKLIFCGI